MYITHVDNDDYMAMSEDIAKLVVNIVLQGDVLKVLICLVRIDCYDQDKDLRSKYSMLKGVQSSEFGIDPYLSLNDAGVLIKEAAKKYKVDIKEERANTEVSQNLVNTTVQLGENGVGNEHSQAVNIGFKQYLQDNKHKLD